MTSFTYAVKTDKGIGRGDAYFTVIASGTKKDMLKQAEVFDAHPETVESKITRESDGEIIHHYFRETASDEPEDEIAQAAQVIKDAGGVVVMPENRERFDAQLKQLHNAEGACDKALAMVNKLTDAIEDMKYDCDAEVYEELLKIADILGR